MKVYIILLFALLIFGANTANAQTSESIRQTEQSIKKNGKYALLVMKVQHLKAGIKTGIAFKAKSEKIDFQIVICGELVKEISKDKELQSLIRKAVLDNGLKILLCGLSIKELNVDESLLPAETPVTENGLIYMFGLQELNYKTIIL
jgi:intracellular sulfur oxidation DsrE/DsrF family protein